MANLNKELTEHNSKAVVLDFINALNAEDFDLARQQLHDEMTFKGVMSERNGADAYMDDMKKMKLKYEVKKVFTDNEDVCLFYDIQVKGKKLFGSGWYGLENEKIKSFKVIFDPRPVLI